MDFKKIIIVCIAALMVLGCVSTVSAGFFDFLKQETTIDISNSTNGSVFVSLNSSNKSVENKTIHVDVVSNNESKNYTVNTTSKPVLVCNLVPGEYNITAKFDGDDQYQEFYTSKAINVTEFSQQAVEDAVDELSKEMKK
ncbi:MAG: hypothetical protein IJJ47_10670 [Methanosphaera sp.]|nr:hypothetical protein [Methanosphaera sp.]